MPVAPYGTEKYRSWNRERMAEYRGRIVVPLGDDWSQGLSYAAVETHRRDMARRKRRITAALERLAEKEEE